MDPQEPAFQALLLEQAQMHVERIPSFEGIAIDRLDYSAYYSLKVRSALGSGVGFSHSHGRVTQP
jgi:hypothetical protein